MGKTELTLRPFLWRAERLFPDKELVSYGADGVHRYTYSEYADRVAQLSHALEDAGIGPGDTVGTFCWNHHRHFETYFAVPDVGATLHTINLRLPDEHVAHLLQDAEDKLLFVDSDPDLIAQLERVGADGELAPVEQFVVMGSDIPETDLEPVVDYESFIDGYGTTYHGPPLSEDQPAAMCYTSGTTGKPKGVEYTHKMLWTQMMVSMSPNGFGFDETDVVLQTVPMFHLNGWAWPYVATALGSKLVFPGPSPGPADLANLIESESVTFTGGVPTVWVNFLEYVEGNDVDLSSLERVFNGGGRPPMSLLRRFEEDYGVEYQAASGMTEVTSVATTATIKSKGETEWSDETRWARSQKAGLIVPGMKFRVLDEDGEDVPWDGETVGELHYQGPWVIDAYYQRPDANEENFVELPPESLDESEAEDVEPERWLKTGDLVTVDEEGYIDIVDRKDDMIKSGGEWISSVDLENTLMDHETIVEAAVVGVPHDRWGERPLAFVVTDEDTDRERLVSELESFVQAEYPKWWTPDAFEFLDEIPKTGTGKFDKKFLRKERADPSLLAGVPDATPEDD